MQIKQNLYEDPKIVHFDPLTGGYYIIIEGERVPCDDEGHPTKH